MDEEIKQHLQKKSTWIRAMYMLLFGIIFGILEVVIVAVVVFQFFTSLFTGKTNDRLLILGQSLSTYLYQITLFLTFNSNFYPYPFGSWPKGAPTAPKATTKEAPKAATKTSPKKTSKASPKKKTG
jgi:hypothetical protein